MACDVSSCSIKYYHLLKDLLFDIWPVLYPPIQININLFMDLLFAIWPVMLYPPVQININLFMDFLFHIWPVMLYPPVQLNIIKFVKGLAVRFMAGDVVSSCSVIKELVTLAAGQYKGDSFEIGKFDFFLKPISAFITKIRNFFILI